MCYVVSQQKDIDLLPLISFSLFFFPSCVQWCHITGLRLDFQHHISVELVFCCFLKKAAYFSSTLCTSSHFTGCAPLVSITFRTTSILDRDVLIKGDESDDNHASLSLQGHICIDYLSCTEAVFLPLSSSRQRLRPCSALSTLLQGS